MVRGQKLGGEFDLIEESSDGDAVIPIEFMARSSIALREDSGSSKAIGSSARITLAPWTRQRAGRARCCWPPDRVAALCQAVCSMPTAISASSARCRSAPEKRMVRLRHRLQRREQANNHIGHHRQAVHRMNC